MNCVTLGLGAAYCILAVITVQFQQVFLLYSPSTKGNVIPDLVFLAKSWQIVGRSIECYVNRND